MIIFGVLHSAGPAGDPQRAALASCAAAEPVLALPVGPVTGNEQAWRSEALQRFTACAAPAYRAALWWLLGGVLLILVIAMLVSRRWFWRAFVAFGIVPMIVVLAHPSLLRDPLSWRPSAAFAEADWPKLAGLAMLCALAFAARPALPRKRNPVNWPTVAAELFGIGLVTALVAANVAYGLALALPNQVAPNELLAGMLTIGLATVPLGLAVWRVVRRAGQQRPSLWAVAAPAVAVTAGLVAGDRLAPYAALTVPWAQPQSAGAGGVALRGVLLLAGMVVVACWTASALRSARTAGRRGGWPVTAVVAAATVAAMPWLGLWRAKPVSTGMFHLGDAPAAGGSISWYGTVAPWLDQFWATTTMLLHNAFVLPALALLWVVPLWLLRKPGALRRALLAATLATLAMGVTAVALVFLARAVLPAQVRVDAGFAEVFAGLCVAIAAVAQAAVAGVLARGGSDRGLQIGYAVSVTALTGTVLVIFAMPLARCGNLFESASRLGRRCVLPSFDAVDLTDRLYLVATKGMALAALTALAVAAFTGRTARAAAQPAPLRLRRTVLVSSVIVVAAVVAAAGVQARHVRGRWTAVTEAGSANGVLAALADRVVMDPCLVGSWQEISRVVRVGGEQIRIAGHGRTVGFRADGRGVVGFNTDSIETTTLPGLEVAVAGNGQLPFTFKAHQGKIDYRLDAPDTTDASSDLYRCEVGGSLALLAPNGAHEVRLRRVSHAPPPLPPAAADDGCLVGTWRETAHVSHDQAWWSSSGALRRFAADGTGALVYGARTVHTAKVGQALREKFSSGEQTFRYTAAGGVITHHPGQALFYSCTGDTLRLSANGFAAELVRVGGA